MTDKVAAMHVRVASPFSIYYDDSADSLSAENATGPFDVLPGHHNFISLLGDCQLTVRNHGEDTRIDISGGLLHVRDGQAVVFLNV